MSALTPSHCKVLFNNIKCKFRKVQTIHCSSSEKKKGSYQMCSLFTKLTALLCLICFQTRENTGAIRMTMFHKG